MMLDTRTDWRPGRMLDEGLLEQTGDPWRNLGSAVVWQAAEDYRNALWYLKRRNAPRLQDYVNQDTLRILKKPLRWTAAERRFYRNLRGRWRWEFRWQVAWRIENDQRQVRRAQRTGGYRAWKRANDRWEAAAKTAAECEEFFRGDWFRMLTDLDGEALLERLRQEAECWDAPGGGDGR